MANGERGKDLARSTSGPKRIASEMAEAYAEYRPLLLSALSRLARQGYPVRLGESMDMIHDFFVEAWPGLQRRYDPTQGAFATYVFGAFVHFARPRILRSLRWEQSLFDTDDLAAAAQRSLPSVDGSTHPADLQAVREAVGTLSPLERNVVIARIVNGQSERLVSQRLGLSRYRVRETSARALARLAGALNEPGVLTRKEYQLSSVLWKDGRTVAEAAALLGMTQKQVRLVRRRLLQALNASISGKTA